MAAEDLYKQAEVYMSREGEGGATWKALDQRETQLILERVAFIRMRIHKLPRDLR